MDDVTGEWRKLHNEELNELSYSPNIVRVIIEKNEMGGAYSTYEGEERCIQGFGGKIRVKDTIWNTQAQMGRKY
jgi:hypothetical protein